ncbi:MAG: DUF4250 domain-containing protein [Muribaculaceae bacterium]|nr:DUF4250 domain-containing protein [Muribaculaceae bacterium]
MIIPNDPMILLCMVNTKLRDYYPTLDDLCESEDVDQDEIKAKLATIGYVYSPQLNKFI